MALPGRSTLNPGDAILYPTDNTTVSLLQAALCVLQDPAMPLCHTKGATMLSNSSFMLENGVLVVLPYGKRYTSHEFVIRADGTAVVCNSSPILLGGAACNFRLPPRVHRQPAPGVANIFPAASTAQRSRHHRHVPLRLHADDASVDVALSNSPRVAVSGRCLALTLEPVGNVSLELGTSIRPGFHLTSQSFGHMSKRSRSRILRCYIMLCWLLPLFVVVSLGVMDHYGIYDVGYAAGGQCFIGTRSAILWLVIAPMSFTLLFNFACFVCAFSTIFHTAKLMQKSTTSSQGPYNPVDKRRLFVYIRITLIMGFTWAVGFTAAFVQLEELWIANIVLNASQGFYFLIAFVLKRRVWSLVWDRFSSLRSSRSGSLHPHRKTRPCQAASWKPLQR
ncbi:hypothetical protein C0Q70_19951 [Pomacea canaliculata]|uniref:G-protein coupled receptors family 2 profile 2 domain-containing protein n=1 Tax=Pomacea canaliculata TaxID=400727 RepID=A0A2T7NE96_POMCA|nr:hypothetical protein C0Q70_19951 [Pomacea canaliculata]